MWWTIFKKKEAFFEKILHPYKTVDVQRYAWYEFCWRGELGDLLSWLCCHAPPNIFEKSFFFLTRSLRVIHRDRRQTFVLLRWLFTDFSRSESGVRRSHVRSVCRCAGACVLFCMPVSAAFSRQIQRRTCSSAASFRLQSCCRIGWFTEISFSIECTFPKKLTSLFARSSAKNDISLIYSLDWKLLWHFPIHVTVRADSQE